MVPLLYILRHGRTDWNVEERLQGQADIDINACGRAQADRNGNLLAEVLDDPSRFDFVASPLRRTCETMERVRTRMGLDPTAYRTDSRLKEVHFGDWQGFTYLELERQNPGCTRDRDGRKWHFLPPGSEAESYEILARRVRLWLETLEKPTICVTHGGVIRTILHWMGGISVEEAAEIRIPHDRVLRVEGGRLEWL